MVYWLPPNEPELKLLKLIESAISKLAQVAYDNYQIAQQLKQLANKYLRELNLYRRYRNYEFLRQIAYDLYYNLQSLITEHRANYERLDTILREISRELNIECDRVPLDNTNTITNINLLVDRWDNPWNNSLVSQSVLSLRNKLKRGLVWDYTLP